MTTFFVDFLTDFGIPVTQSAASAASPMAKMQGSPQTCKRWGRGLGIREAALAHDLELMRVIFKHFQQDLTLSMQLPLATVQIKTLAQKEGVCSESSIRCQSLAEGHASSKGVSAAAGSNAASVWKLC